MKVNALSDSLQATKNDPRKTKFGNFLRKSNLDELPQFINVFKGEMSICRSQTPYAETYRGIFPTD